MDNRKSIASPAETTNQSTDHEHVYKLKGGPTYWAQSECGEKLNRGNGVICGSSGKVLKAIG